MTENQHTYFVCPAPPCPNGKLHLGHIGGVYLLTDIFVRFQRMVGHVAYHVTGADEHGTYTLVKALKLGRAVDEVAQMHIGEIMNCLHVMGIEPDEFVRTSSEDHIHNSLAIYEELDANGYIDIRDSKQLYCETCGEFAADSLAVGQCPECNAPTDSNLCENCGLAVQHSLLRNPKHTTCGNSLTLQPIRQAYFDVEKLADALDHAIKTSEWPEVIKHKECGWLSLELRALPMSRHFSRGVALPAPADVAGQTLLTWFEGLWCFDTGIRRICERNSVDYNLTMRNPNVKTLFFMGQDNRFYYTVGVTASLLARDYPIPTNHSIQDFYKLEGAKFSTSRDHVLWADEVSAHIDQSVLRYYLTSIAKPFGNDDNDFKIEGLVHAAARIHEFEIALRNHVERAENVISTELKSDLSDIVKQYVSAINDLRFWDALEAINSFFVAASFDTPTTSWNATEVFVFLSMMYPVTPALAIHYGKLFFGDEWLPSIWDRPTSSSFDVPSAAADLHLFGTPIPETFIAAYETRFRQKTAA